MSGQTLSILSIGLDRDLLSRDTRTEAQTRQLLYAQALPARLVHLVKAPPDANPERSDLAENLCVVPCPVRHWSGFVLAAIRKGTTWLRRERFDLIQVQEPIVSGMAGAYLAKRFGLPLVVGLFGDEIGNPVWLAERWLNRIGNHIGKWVLRQASAVRCDSLAVVHQLSHYGFRHLTFIPFLITHAERLLAPDTRAPEIRQRLLNGSPGPLLLAVCRLEQEKNVPLMLSALGAAASSYPGMVLTVAGDGTQASALKLEAERKAPGRVRWLGWIPNHEMPAYYQAADLLLLSSNRESAARVLYESLLAGTPVLTTDTAGAREVIEDGITGRVVAVGDVQAFTRALIEMCAQPARLAEMGEEGRRRIKTRVSAEAVVAQLRLLYEKALGRGV